MGFSRDKYETFENKTDKHVCLYICILTLEKTLLVFIKMMQFKMFVAMATIFFLVILQFRVFRHI